MMQIELKDIVKHFPSSVKGEKELVILNGINLSVEEGESVAITGNSGSGKSTLLQIAGALDKPTSGQVLCHGIDFCLLDDKKKSQLRNNEIGFIFQANLLLEDFTALENVMIPALISGKTEKQCKDRASQLLSSLGLEERFTHLPSQLSGGEKQRVAICRALMNEPGIILADEPTGALHNEIALEIEELLLGLVRKENRSLLLVTHNPDFASKCDRVFKLSDNSLISLKG